MTVLRESESPAVAVPDRPVTPEVARHQRNLQRALDASQRLALTNPGGFSGILQALDDPGVPPVPRD